MKKILLNYNQNAEHRFTEKIKAIPEILETVKAELTKQKVDHNLTLYDLQDGNFISKFEEFHNEFRNKHYPKMCKNRYYKNLNINTDKLTELERDYKGYLNTKYLFYVENHDYWYLKETFGNEFQIIKHTKAPKKKEYTTPDFLSISKDSYKINVDSEFFKLYATNENQVDQMNEVTQIIKLAKKRKADISQTIKLTGGLIKLDRDYNITWDYNEILNIL